ncbi:unnamed protein product, partial [Iphiclides podalirius]
MGKGQQYDASHTKGQPTASHAINNTIGAKQIRNSNFGANSTPRRRPFDPRARRKSTVNCGDRSQIGSTSQ